MFEGFGELLIALGIGEDGQEGCEEVHGLRADKVQRAAHFQRHQSGRGESTSYDFVGNPVDGRLLSLIRLGRAGRIRRLEIDWPTTGLTQTFEDVPMDRFVCIVEGAGAIETIELRRLRLGTRRRE